MPYQVCLAQFLRLKKWFVLFTLSCILIIMESTQTNVLLVDGDINLSTVLADYLCATNFAVDTVADGISALNAVKQKKYDICLLELNLQGAIGRGFAGASEVCP